MTILSCVIAFLLIFLSFGLIVAAIEIERLGRKVADLETVQAEQAQQMYRITGEN